MLIHIPYMEHTVWDILYPHLSPSTTLPGRPFRFCCSQRVQRGNWPGGPWLWSIKNWGWWICPCTMFCSYKKLKPWTPTEHSFWIQHVCFSHRGENHSHKNKQTNALYSYTTYHNFWSSVVLSFQSRNTGTIRDTKTASIQNSSMPGDHGKSSSKMCILLSCGETQCVAPWLPMLPTPKGIFGIWIPLRTAPSTDSTGYQVIGGYLNFKKTGMRGLIMLNNMILLP